MKGENCVERAAEGLGDEEGKFEGGRVFGSLDRHDGLPRHANLCGEVGLGHLVGLKAQAADVVGDFQTHSGAAAVQAKLDQTAGQIAEKKAETHMLGLITSVWIATPLTSPEAKIALRDLTPIARLVLEPAVFAVRADSPYKTMKDFIEAARANPGKLKQSGGSMTSRDSIMRQALQQHTGTKWAFVSFQGGGERIAALLGGHVDMMIIEPQEAGEQIRAGKMRVLAQIAEKPLPGYPGVPTLKEAGYDVTVPPQIRAVMAPPGIPREVAAYWEDLFDKLHKTETWKKYVAENQLDEGFLTGPELPKSIDKIENELRVQYQQAGVKTVR